MKGKPTSDKLLAQDDIDALFGQAELEAGCESEEPASEPTEKPVKRSDEDLKAMLVQLYDKALFERDRDVKVIWNASGNCPMTSGFSINIQGIEYISLGVFHENHLVVRCMERT